MAFSVTPTSGASPYTLEAEFSNTTAFQSGMYTLNFFQESASGSCPTPSTSGANAEVIAQALINDGVYITGGANPVPAGFCRTYLIVIKRVSDGSVIDQSSATVNNIGG